MSEPIDSTIEAILKGEIPKAVPSRRAFPRYSASYPVLLEFDQPAQAATNGVTVNMSRSGLLASFEEPVPAGAVCRITFLPRDRYRPELIECPHCGSEFPTLELPEEPVPGTVVRLERRDEGAFVAAIMFDEPLDAVSEGSDVAGAG